MSDVSQAVTQDQIADSLLGTPEESSTAEAPGTEQQEAVQTEPEGEEQAAESEPEAAEDWLPSDQDKVFPDEVYARYAERYKLSPEQAADPLLRQLLHDKINTDIFVRQQLQQQEQEQEAEPEPEAEPTRAEPLSREQWFQQLDQMVQQTTDPAVAKAFHHDFLQAFGVPEAEIAKAPAEQAMRFTATASKYMLNLLSTHLPGLMQTQLAQQIGQAFPDFSKMYERSSHAMAWDTVRNSSPEFAKLPAYGTKEFRQAMSEAAEKVPEIAEMIEEAAGKPMNAAAVGRWYKALARVATGQNVDPALVAKAAAAGARNASRAATRRAAGNLGSGQSKAGTGSATSSRFQSNQDLFDDETMAIYQREHGRL